ncbi:MAG: Gfo/Idh/MocA family oxidoreductase [Chloroflexota bacterium]
MDKLKLAIVGCGDIAAFTALVSRLVPQVSLAACCDVDAERAGQFARRFGIPRVSTDYTELLGNAAVDAAYLAVPHHLHYEMVLAFIRAGKAVFVEKPVTRTLAEGLELVEVIRNSQVKVGVNYQYRYDRACYPLARAIQAGELGKVHSLRINIPWHRTQAYFDKAPWHKRIAQAGGGTLITQGSHLLDIALWALGDAPISAMGYTASLAFDVEVEALAHGIVETASGTLVSITSSMVAASEQALTIEAYGERGTARYRNLPWPAVKFVGVKTRKPRPPGWGVHALQRSLAGFARWVLADQPFLIPAESTLPVLAAVDGIYRSAVQGRRVSIASL